MADSLDRLLRMPEVLDYCALSKSTLWRYVQKGLFPQPYSLGGRRIAWSENEVKDWRNSLFQQQAR
jgi:prophage regulatory protein